MVWCSRTGGCTIMRNARPFLDELSREWRNVDEITISLASKLDCSVDDARDGVESVVDELVSQRFLEVEARDVAPLPDYHGEDVADTSPDSHKRISADDDWTPLGDFYARHRLPCELHIDLTDGCNEKCVHCYLPKGGAHYISKDIALKALKEFREAQGLTVYLSGGECMLHKDFAEIMRYAKSINLNIIVMSNLTLCDENIVALLKEVDPQYVNVSLYAVTEDIHDSITQVQGSCSKTKAAIDALQVAGVHVRVATPFMRENKECVEELRNYTKGRRVHLIADTDIFGAIDHSGANNAHVLSIEETEKLVTTNKYVFSVIPMESTRCDLEAKVCNIGDTRLNLDAEGRYYPCDGFHGAIIGDARKDSLWDVWTGAALNKLRALKNKDFGACASCVDRAWCKVCPMRNFNETGNMFIHKTSRCNKTRLYRRIFEGKTSC